jgi:stringent starvation protein B
MDVANRPPKKDAFVAFLEDGWVWVHFDARRPGVQIPAGFGDNPRLVLQYGYDMPVPIPDLTVEDDGIRATLSFNRVPQPTFVPWSAVYILACTDGRGVVYLEDVPEEVVIQMQAVAAEAGLADASGQARPEADSTAEVPSAAGRGGAPARAPSAQPRSTGRGRPALAMVPLPDSDPDAEADTADSAPARARRPRLRLVK